MDQSNQRAVAKRLLTTTLGLPDGVASREVRQYSEAQLLAVCQVADEPHRTRRQVLKAVRGAIVEPPPPTPRERLPAAPAQEPAGADEDDELEDTTPVED